MLTLIKGKIRKGVEIQGISHITVEFSVDELMKNNTPNVNFWLFCLNHDLIMQWKKEDDGDDNFYSTINLIDLTLSEDEEKNRIIKEMFKKLDIPVF